MPRKYVRDMTPEEREAHRKEWHYKRFLYREREVAFYNKFRNGPVGMSISSYPRGSQTEESVVPVAAPENG